ncbi:NAD-glutamate dehydrogenase domain-containing protein, partial [Nocardia farcinica]
VDERPYQLELDSGAERWIYDFGLLARPELLRNALGGDLDAALLERDGHEDELHTRFTDAVEAVWYGRAEADSLNEL